MRPNVCRWTEIFKGKNRKNSKAKNVWSNYNFVTIWFNQRYNFEMIYLMAFQKIGIYWFCSILNILDCNIVKILEINPLTFFI